MPFFGSLATFVVRAVLVVVSLLNVVTTLAGTGVPGFVNGPLSFNYLSGIAFDSSGNLYVSDQNNNSIGKITPENVVTRLAGNGITSSVDGTGTNATFYWPSGITIDSSGNLYVCEYAGHVVRKITPAGVVTTLAGSGTGESLDGTGTNARFYSPNGIAIDLSGNLYVSDLNGSKLRKVTSAGVVTTLAGSGSGGYADGTGTNAQFWQPSGLTVDLSGNVFLADRLNHRIRKITSAGVVTTLAGSGTGQGTSTGSFADGTGINARFSMPQGVAVDSSGNVYVVDGFNHRIRKVTSAGVVTTFAGNGTLSSVDGTGTNATFFYPNSILIDSSGNLYIGNGNNTIRKITPSAVVTTLSATTYSDVQVQFNTPFGVATDWDGNVYVADSANQRIRKITPSGVTTTFAGSGTAQFGDGTGASASFNYPYAVTVDSAQNVYVSDSVNYRIRKITPGAVVSTLAGSGTAATTNGTGASAAFNLPRGITVDLLGNVYVSEQNGHVVRKITSGGVVTILAGTSGTSGSSDATGTAASFNSPFGVVADVFGNVYVSDTYNHRIRRITSDGIVTTLAGSTVGFNDATGTNAKFNFPETIAIDPLGVLYVAEEGGDRIRKITPAGVVTTLAGTGTVGFTNGAGLSASFRNPHGIAVDRFRQAYVGDKDNHAVRKIADAYTLPENNGVVTTFVGSGTTTFTDGTGIGATFNNPGSVGVDSAGNVYVGDIGNQRIRKITPAGVVTTFAGNGGTTFTDGTGTNATFNSPRGVVLDSTGNVYVADLNNHRIRKITPAGVVTTLAGGTPGFANATGTNASFNQPWGITLDLAGNLYVGDYSNHRIRKITPAGVVTTLAGNGTASSVNGTGTNATFNFPQGVSLDLAGNLYVGEGNRIRKITPEGVTSTLAGSGTSQFGNGTGTNASFSNPWGVTVDSSGTVYVADYTNHRIRKITPEGVVTTLAGNGITTFTDGIGGDATFNAPSAITVDPSGTVYVADQLNHRIRKIGYSVQLPLNRGVVTTIAGNGTITFANGTGTSATFNQPELGIALDSLGNVFIADTSNNRIRRITSAGVVTTFAGSGTGAFTNGTGSGASFNIPLGVAVDSGGNVYVGDRDNNRIRKITPLGVVTTLAGSGTPTFINGTGTNATFNQPTGIAVDSAGNVYVCDKNNHSIRRITPEGVVTTLAGSGTQGYANGTGNSASFRFPYGIAVDSAGNVYVGDNNNHSIRRITQAGVVTTLAGSGTQGSANGTGTNASFRLPTGVTVDSVGNVYVGDTENHCIRRITPEGVVTTLAGSGTGAFTDGTGTNAQFNQPTGITVDSGGILYVIDSSNHRIRKIS